MPTLADVKTDVLYCMFKGEPGTRKSTQALSFPTPQYWFSTDLKMNSLILPMKDWGVKSSEIEYDDYVSYTLASQQGKKSFQQKLDELQMNCKYKTIIFDSITSIGDVINRQTLTNKSGTTNKDGRESGLRIGGIPVNTLDDYKAEAATFNEIVAKSKDISAFHGCNVILIAHVIGDRSAQDKGSITNFSRIIITGGKVISGKIPAYCQEVYHFDVEKAVVEGQNNPNAYRCFTTHTGDDFARTALPLEQILKFGNRRLYNDYLEPAMKKLNEQQAVTKI